MPFACKGFGCRRHRPVEGLGTLRAAEDEQYRGIVGEAEMRTRLGAQGGAIQ